MKNRFYKVLFTCVLLVVLTACSSENDDDVPISIEEQETEVTVTAAPTKTPEPTSKPTEVPVAADTYEKGILTEEFFASEWMNLRFTSQSGFEFGTRPGIEMFVRNGKEAGVEVYTELLAEEELKLSEEEYIHALFEKQLDGYENSKIVQQGEVLEIAINGDEFTWIWSLIDNGQGEMFYRDYMVRKKESRMMVLSISRIYAGASLQSATNLIRCFGAYDDPPVYLPEEWLAPNPFEKGAFSDGGYENEWLNLRISLPEDATLREVESDILDSVYAEIEWETNLPYIQFMIAFANNQTAKDYLTGRMELLKSEALSRKEEGFEFLVDEQIKTELLGGQEYIVMKSLLRRPESTDRYQEFYCRVQDNYFVYFVFLYDIDSENKIKNSKIYLQNINFLK